MDTSIIYRESVLNRFVSIIYRESVLNRFVSIIYRERVLNRFVCKCEEKNVMANEIVGFGALNFFKKYLE